MSPMKHTHVKNLLACCALLAAGFLLTSLKASAQTGVQAGYTVPQFVVPYAPHPPTLDGVIRDGEWADALSFTALQTSSHAVSSRQTRFWMMWDADNLYIAMRSPLRPGERLLQAHRIRTTDQEQAVFDDAYEIFIDAGTHSPNGEPVYFQYLGNYAGARYDDMYEPAVGNQRPGWTADWPVANRLTPDGRAWEMELAIPRRSLYRDTPFTDGFTFTSLLARDYKRPWEQNSVSGAGSFAVRDTYAHFTLSRTAPGVQLLSVGDPQAQTFGLALAASSATAQTLRWSFDSDGGVHQQGTLPVQPVAPAVLPPMLGLDKPGTGAYRIRVTSADAKTTYLDWSAQRQWGDLSPLTQTLNDTGDQVTFSLQFNPIRNLIRATGDLIDYDNRAQIARSVITVQDSQGKQLASKSVGVDALAYINDVVPLSDLAPGSYKATLTTYDGAGKVLFTRVTAFDKKPVTDFAWWNTPMGNADRVLSPWTPVRYAAGQFAVWGRSMRVGAAGLPAQVVAQGRPLLARPTQLVATLGGRTIRAAPGAPSVLSRADNRVVTVTQSNIGRIAVRSVTTVEYDGMYRVDMTLTPRGPVRLDSLKVVVPLRSSMATYLHACGEGIRYGFTDEFLPMGKQGTLWSSKDVDGQPMTVGSFIPYVWLGDPTSGLCWFADSDQGWTPDATVPAIAVTRPTPGSTNLVLNLIGRPTVLDAPRTITFAFEATPTRPLQPNWRMNTWWTGDSFKDWAQVESEGHAGDEGLIFSSLPFPLDPAKSKQMVDARHLETDGIFGVARYHANAVPYFEHINMGEQFVPDLTYFGDEWRTHVTRGLAYGKTLQDFMVYHVGNWAQDCGIDGFYIDNVAPIADDNIEAGRGYRLPDGRIQPAYQMFDTRRYFLRMRAALAEQGKSGYFVMHVTNHMIAPWIESADVALDGEDHVIYPEMGKDFMDFWTPERLRLDIPEEWGTPVNFLQEYQGNWDPARLTTAMRAYTGMLLLQDTLVSANANGNNVPVWQARDRFGMQADDVRFLAPWSPNSGLTGDRPTVRVAGWLRPMNGSHTLMLAVVNTGEACRASVRVTARTLGLPDPSRWLVTDAETQQPLTSDGSPGTLTVSIPRHDYRLLLIQPRP